MKRKHSSVSKRKRKKNKNKKVKGTKFKVSRANVARGLYSLRDDVKLHPELVKYDKNILMRQIRHNGIMHTAISTDTKSGIVAKVGLLRKLKNRFYHEYVRSTRRTKTIKKSAGKKVGLVAHTYVEKSVQFKGKLPPRCSKHAKAVLCWWKENGHELQGAELPVHMKQNGIITRGDFFTVKRKGTLSGFPELWYWELKCGWSPAIDKKKGYMNQPLDHVPCSLFNIYELQRQWTHWAFEEELGMKIHASRVIHVYEHERDGMIVVPRDIPIWCKSLNKEKLYNFLDRPDVSV